MMTVYVYTYLWTLILICRYYPFLLSFFCLEHDDLEHVCLDPYWCVLKKLGHPYDLWLAMRIAISGGRAGDAPP